MTAARKPSGEVAQLACIATLPVDSTRVGDACIVPDPWGMNVDTERRGVGDACVAPGLEPRRRLPRDGWATHASPRGRGVWT